jgi:alpha-galactosidase
LPTGSELLFAGITQMNIPENKISSHRAALHRFHKTARIASCALIFLAFASRAEVKVERSEQTQAREWTQDNLFSARKAPPFSFVYNGKNSGEFLQSWTRQDSRRTLDANRVEHVITWKDPATQLVVKCRAVEYKDYPMVEWTVYLKNDGLGNTPTLEDIQGLDTRLSRGNGREFLLNGNQGDYCDQNSYHPFQIPLPPSAVTNFAPPSYSGKSSDGPQGWPYYNLQVPGGGIILAIGWPGQWASSFTRDTGDGLRIKAGQQTTHLYLKPGEEIRTPLIAMLFWKGNDLARAQNIWRHFYLAHVIPRRNGKTTQPQLQIQVGGDSTNYVSLFLEDGIQPTLCWRDAGGAHTWYPNEDGPYKGGDAWLNTGTWDIDTTRYPNGFKPFSDWIHTKGMEFILWFEPERAGNPKSWLGTNHPDWLLPSEPSSGGSILNEGNPEAFRWLTNHIQNIITANGLDWYREDMNGTGPALAWQKNDAPDRKGILENFYVQGHLAYWDALLAMNPNLKIDSCASGGRRNDLETMRRAVPLLRSDFQFPSQENFIDGNQCHTYALSSWLPYQGTGALAYYPYAFRSYYIPSFGMGELTKDNESAQRQAYDECSRIAPIMLYGDYYPLTPYSLSRDVWIGWQFNRPEAGDGCVQAFRRADCKETSLTLHLADLKPNARYELENFDMKGSSIFTGDELMNKGLTIVLENAPGSVVIKYQRVK